MEDEFVEASIFETEDDGTENCQYDYNIIVKGTIDLSSRICFAIK